MRALGCASRGWGLKGDSGSLLANSFAQLRFDVAVFLARRRRDFHLKELLSPLIEGALDARSTSSSLGLAPRTVR